MLSSFWGKKEVLYQRPTEEPYNVIVIDRKKEREDREKVDQERINKIISYLSNLTGERVDYRKETSQMAVTEYFSLENNQPVCSIRTNYCIGINFEYSSDAEIAKAFGNFIAGLGYNNGVVVYVNVQD